MTPPVRSSARQLRHWAMLFCALVGFLPAQVTETPYTIQPGHFLLEIDAITIGVDRDATAPQTYTALGLASAILSTGLTSNLDVQVGMQFFLRQKYEFRGARETTSGRGDTSVRMKWTFWRDGPAAAAVIPYIKLPSNTGGVGNNHVEGGFIVPWAMSLGHGTELGAMGRWDFLRDASNSGYDSRWFFSSFAHQHLFGRLGAYAEATMSVSSASASTFTGGLGAGVLLDFSKNLQFDYGISRGLGNRATDWTHVFRVNWRF